MDRVGDNEVLIRGKTNHEDYKLGKVNIFLKNIYPENSYFLKKNLTLLPLLHHPIQAYTIRRDTFRSYCQDLLSNNARARSSYLAVASLQQAFPQLKDELPINDYIKSNGKIHLGPYMWVALKGHYEFCHYDPGK